MLIYYRGGARRARRGRAAGAAAPVTRLGGASASAAGRSGRAGEEVPGQRCEGGAVRRQRGCKRPARNRRCGARPRQPNARARRARPATHRHGGPGSASGSIGNSAEGANGGIVGNRERADRLDRSSLLVRSGVLLTSPKILRGRGGAQVYRPLTRRIGYPGF
jgi:hypothetical protein